MLRLAKGTVTVTLIVTVASIAVLLALCRAAGDRRSVTDIPGLTDEHKPRSRGPKRANKIRKLYNLGKDDDVRQAAKLHGKTVEKNGKTFTKTVKIQRLVTPTTLQRKRRRAALKKSKIEKVRAHHV